MWQIANHNCMGMKLIDSRFVSVALVIIISRSGHTRYKNYWSGNGTQDLLLHVVFGYCRLLYYMYVNKNSGVEPGNECTHMHYIPFSRLHSLTIVWEVPFSL